MARYGRVRLAGFAAVFGLIASWVGLTACAVDIGSPPGPAANGRHRGPASGCGRER